MFYFWKFIHNQIHGWLMSWPWEPAWVTRLHDWTAANLGSELSVITVTEQTSGYYVAQHSELISWAGGRSVDEALGNWLRTHQKNQNFRIEIKYLRSKQ